MSKSRVSSSRRKARRSAQSDVAASQQPPQGKSVARYLGLSLSGGKADKSSFVAVDFFKEQRRLFLSVVFDKVRSEEFISADKKLLDLIRQFSENAVSISFDVPLSLPPCFRCDPGCQGFELCQQPQVKWMRDLYHQSKKKKPKKMLTPYTQRPVELYLSYEEGGVFEIQHALGANLGPLTARAQYLLPKILLPKHEVVPKVVVFRLGQFLKLNRSVLLSYRNQVGGEDARRQIFQAMVDQWKIFVYQQDFREVIENLHTFEAVIAAFTGYLADHQMVSPRPEGFPEDAEWVLLPEISKFSKRL